MTMEKKVQEKKNMTMKKSIMMKSMPKRLKKTLKLLRNRVLRLFHWSRMKNKRRRSMR